jgi:hypothetical protein
MVLMVLGGGILLIALYLACEMWLLVWEQRTPSPLERVLVRARARTGRLRYRQFARDIRRAEQTCPVCPALAACREWLAGGEGRAVHGFCPNAELVERVTR